ncbi:MAG: hypothetical protein ACTSWH_06500 [Promethearchaeota archaeon]
MALIDRDLSVLSKKKVYFFDLDGTIYMGDVLFDGVLELIQILKKKKKYFTFYQIILVNLPKII